ncbi:phosphate/phosphite/phosphonate ABC transporter substrate-binding protein [Fortiea sp. LEGE XX443]|uniref:phosphate/phosphite/phosphonate ABC transporter substrate-binding protein n=1 Tax=Fortiea sp. LEGE XX443 TaxID=1828611 RepID=UPI00187EEB6E|nr:phosphate/phosphite/phosphonate ABC transporter substrate-binding protein [Fortiea sp. LEGE XX443]MBE9005784.1 phosphate/phosphite/phosphonate ABC transporter substrate-binding protein [Fortiea sp. LEGE XX443]
MKRRKLLSYSLLFLSGFITACNSSKQNSEISIAAPKNLKFTVTDVNNLKELEEDYGELRKTLEEVLGVKIEFFLVENRTAAASALVSGKLDIAFAGPSEYLILNARAKSIPIIGVKRPNYHSIIVVRADSKVKSLAQLQDKTIAMRSIGSTSGHIGPTKLLIDGGLDPKKDVKIVMLGNKGLQALNKGEVDAWVTASDTYNNELAKEKLSGKDFSVIVKGSLLPNDVFVGSNQLTSDFVADMRSRMLANQDKLIQSIVVADKKFQGASLTAANDTDYNMIREVYQKMGEGSFL